MNRVSLFGWCILCVGLAAQGADVYVAVDGNDGSSGSLAAPLATLTEARDRVRDLSVDATITDGATELTISAWIYPDTKGDNEGFISSDGDYFGMLFSGYGEGQPIEMRAKGNRVTAPDNSCPVGEWHHVTGVWKSGQYQRLYIDGSLVASDTSSIPSGSISTDTWMLGTDRFINNRYFDGKLKQLYVWKRALSDGEVGSLAGNTAVPSGHVMSQIAEKEFNGSNETLVLNKVEREHVNIWMRGGRYPITSTLAMEPQDSDITIAAYPGEEPILDGSKFIPTAGFILVEDDDTLARLNPAAQGRVYALTITDSSLITLVKNPDAQLSLNDLMLQQSRFPNEGFTYGDSVDTSTEGSANATGTETDPEGAKFTLRDTPLGDWEAELNRDKKARVRGYVSADWQKVTLRIYEVSSNYRVHLMDATSYGYNSSGVNRPYIDNLLCEIDEPGEWYYDDLENKLYLWPYGNEIGSDSVLGVWAGPSMFTLNGENIRLENLTMQCVGNSNNAFVNHYGTSNVTAGCTFRYCPPGSVSYNMWSESRSSGALSCTFYDIDNCSRLYSGSVSNDEIVHGNSFFENCHFTQIYSKSFYGKVTALGGAGNKFRHNLMHNHNGQTVTITGVEHQIEFNEIFNSGIEEGDGGTFYSGAQFASWNNAFQYNFWHHIICIPGMYERAPIFSDDGDLGEICNYNTFYKAGNGFKTNQGAGHTGTGNVSLENINAVYVISSSTTSMYDTNMSYLNSDPTSGDKGNLLGRGMNSFGIDDWDSTITSGNWLDHIHPFWLARFPRFETLMQHFWDDKSMLKYCTFADTVVYNNNDSDGFTAPTQTTRSNTTILSDLNDFADPDTLNFAYNTPLPSWAHDTRFDEIGLYIDAYRTTMPDKDYYRSMVKTRWNGVSSKASGSYDPDTINDRIYYNTGKMIFGIVDPEDATVVTPAVSYNYDPGTATSPVQSGAERITPGANGDIYWSTEVQAIDRDDSGANNYNRDFIYGSEDTTLEIKLPRGAWSVAMNMSDYGEAHDDMTVTVEGELKHSSINSNPTTQPAPYASFTTEVLDGSLSITFGDAGGTDPNWVVSRISPTCSEFISIIPGRIESEYYASGGEGVGYHDTTDGNIIYDFRDDDVDIETRDGSFTIGAIDSGEWLDYVVDTVPGTYDLQIRTAAVTDSKRVAISLDGKDLGTFTATNTGDWGDFITQTIPNVSVTTSGRGRLRCNFPDGGININWIGFKEEPPAIPSNLIATPISISAIDLNWTDEADNEINYLVERKRPADSEWTLLATLPPRSASYSDSNLTADTEYSYRVAAANNSYSSWTDEVTAKTLIDQRIVVDLTATKYDYDLGTDSSRLAGGFTQLAPSSYGDVNWSVPVSAIDRGAVTNSLIRDFVYHNTAATLEHRIANGSWKVTLNAVDPTKVHDYFTVYAEDIKKLSNITTDAGSEAADLNFNTFVADGALTLRFEDTGGGSIEWVLNRISIEKLDNPSQPVAAPVTAQTTVDQPVSFALLGSDADGDPLTYSFSRRTSYGLVSGTAPNLTYTPLNGYAGQDRFTYTVNDGTVDSLASSVTITISNGTVGDSDNDGMPDSWEEDYFGDATSGDPDADPDLDTFSNLEEYIAGTNPNLSSSYLSVSALTRVLSGTVISWESKSDRTYAVEYLESMTNLPSVLQSGIVLPQNSYTDSVDRTTGFYRIKVSN